MSRNNVRGPTSALTEFLRESGITATTIARRHATANANQPVAGPSNTGNNGGDEDEDEEMAGEDDQVSPRRRTRRNRSPEYGSDDLDEPDEETAAPKKRKKLTKAMQEKLKAKAKKDKEGEDEEEDAYTALSKSAWSGTKSSKPPVGSFETCVKCEKQFTVTKYTMAATPGPGYLCHACAKATGADPFKKPATPRKRKTPADKRTIVHFEERRFPTLASLCIQMITRHINDVEALGDIGSINKDELAKALSRNRSLTAENAHLFYDVQNTKLTLYDVTKLTPPGFCTLGFLNPNLTSLQLDFCGRMDDTVISSWADSLPNLVRLELLGPFLVRAPAWQSFFASHPRLTGFLITQSPRFDLECMQALQRECQGLTELRLNQVGKLNDEFADVLKEMKGLTYLDLGHPTTSMSDDALVEMMRAIGEELTHLNLSGHTLLTDAFLMEGIQAHARALTELVMSNVPELTDEGVAEFFNTWTIKAEHDNTSASNPPLTTLNLSRNSTLSSDALAALLSHSGKTLTHLSINGWKEASEESLGLIATDAKRLRWLDVGWCREMDDFIMKAIMEGCGRIKEVKVWGCNRLTENCPRKRNVNIYGVEAHNQAV